MIKATIDGREICVEEGTTILQAAKSAGINIPTLCYFEQLNQPGSCRVCVVELEGTNRLVAACSTPLEEGMVIRTNSPRVLTTRRENVELILSQHNSTCTSCSRNTNCELQSLAFSLGIVTHTSKTPPVAQTWPQDSVLIRDSSKCITCQRCIQVCANVQGTGVWALAGTGGQGGIQTAGGKIITETDCALCGQCITHCPVGALRERDDVDKVRAALADPNKICLVQIAPAVRTAWGHSMGLSKDEATVQRMAAALRKVGFDYVFDTVFSADLTIMEEGSELLYRLGNAQDYSFPMFTSCCPGWVRFIKAHYPHRIAQLSSAKSPQQMFGAIAKSYWAEKQGIDANKVFLVSIMPCLAKKHECALENMNDAGAGQDVDVVLTTREAERLIRAAYIDVTKLCDEELDDPLGDGTGAGVIFGATGGVMEAALRSAAYLATGENPAPESFRNVRENGSKPWRVSEFDLAGSKLRVAVASGLGNAKALMDALDTGEESFDFVEIMACPGGCVGGGGQPICPGKEMAAPRADKLYQLDAAYKLRFSHENPAVVKCYEEYLGAPLSQKAHHLLHSDHNDWSMPHA